MSVALDDNEAKRYERYLLAGGDPKKYRHPAAETTARASNPFDMVMNALKQGKIDIGGRKGSVEEVARAKGLNKVYRDTVTGEMFDQDGNPVTPGPGMTFVPIQKGN